MLKRVMSALLLVTCLTGELVLAADSNPLILDIDTPQNIEKVIIVSGTLGNEWSGFPSVLAADYDETGSQDRLNVTLPIYVTWIAEVDSVVHEPVEVSPSQSLASFDWFAYDEFAFTGWQTSLDGWYTACAVGDFLEAPAGSSYPLNSSGELNVQDTHGGIGVESTLYLLANYTYDSKDTFFVLMLGWAQPKTRFDDVLNDDVNLEPGDTWTRLVFPFGVGEEAPSSYLDTRIVEWVSTDVGYASRRTVDASDLGHLAAHYPSAVRWGWESGETPANSPNFHVNFCPFGSSATLIDNIDFTAWGWDSGDNCGLSKTGDGEDAATILAWFGWAPTGNMVVFGPNGETGPEYELVDPEKMARAIADPYGYRIHPAATSVIPWGQAKGLYR